MKTLLTALAIALIPFSVSARDLNTDETNHVVLMFLNEYNPIHGYCTEVYQHDFKEWLKNGVCYDSISRDAIKYIEERTGKITPYYQGD